MTGHEIRIGGVLRCCTSGDLPDDAVEGTVAPCPHCGDGLRLVTRADGQHWEAKWIRDQESCPDSPTC